MRARYPDVEGFVERDGVSLGYEVIGSGRPTVLLLPTWTILHSRSWKLQVPYLARHFRVVTYDGPGNGRSDPVIDPARYSADSYAADARTVLDACHVDAAVAVGLSLGAAYAVRLASLHADRVLAIVLVGASLPLVPPSRARAAALENLFEPYPRDPRGWQKYNVAYWHDHYEDFVHFFFDQVFPEPHSTKPKEDALGWAMQTSPEILAAETRKPLLGLSGEGVFEGVSCPTLVIHGTDDRLHRHQVGVEAARITGGPLLTLEGSGHAPTLRDPVRVNLAIKDFVDRVAARRGLAA